MSGTALTMMGAILLAQSGATDRAVEGGDSAAGALARALPTLPLLWTLVAGAIALMLLLPASTNRMRALGAVVGMMSLGFLFSGVMGSMTPVSSRVVFWILAGVTLIAAVAAIATPRPVHTAIWFALSVLGTAALMFFQGAQFLAVATIIVYAGAIVVVLLFVLMLAQPEGHDTYDRISWGWYTKSVSAVMGAAMVGVLSFAVSAVSRGAFAGEFKNKSADVLHSAHMARFGGELFGKHLLSIEIAGTLLTVALVGAVAILIHGRDSSAVIQEEPGDE